MGPSPGGRRRTGRRRPSPSSPGWPGRDRTGCGRRRSGRRAVRSSRAPPPGAAAGRGPPRRADPSATRRAAGRSTAASRRWCRSRAAGGALPNGVAVRRRSCRILPGSSPVSGSVARPCVRARVRRVPPARATSNGQQERGRPEGVAAEQGEVPGRARAREDVAGVAGLGEQQGVEVGERAIEQRGQARVVGVHGVRARRAALFAGATTAPVSCTDSDQLRDASERAGTVSGQRSTAGKTCPTRHCGHSRRGRRAVTVTPGGAVGTGSPHLIVSMRGEVGVEVQPQLDGDGLVGPVDQRERLAEAVGEHGAVAPEPDRRVRAGHPDAAQDPDELLRRRARARRARSAPARPRRR